MAKVLAELQSQRSTESDEETYQRAMRDPDVQQIMGRSLLLIVLGSPVLSRPLDAADPGGFAAGPEGFDGPHEESHGTHFLMLSRPLAKMLQIAQKIQKLINAGIIKTR